MKSSAEFETTTVLLLLSDKLDNDNSDKIELNDNSLILFPFFILLIYFHRIFFKELLLLRRSKTSEYLVLITKRLRSYSLTS